MYKLKLLKRIVKGHRAYFLTSLIIYFLFIGIGILTSYNTKLIIHPKSLTFLSTLEHNGLLGLMLIIFGNISFGVGNTILVAYNGLILGITLIGVYNSNGLTPIITGIGPHVATETLATLICCTLGYESLRFIRIIKKNSKSKIINQIHIKDSVILLIVAIIFFLISAIIETNISHA